MRENFVFFALECGKLKRIRYQLRENVAEVFQKPARKVSEFFLESDWEISIMMSFVSDDSHCETVRFRVKMRKITYASLLT